MERAPLPPRAALLRALGESLRRGSPPLEVFAEHILGLEARIDLVARDGSGQCFVIGIADAGHDLLALGNLLAQRAWLEPRLNDWLQLAPSLALEPSLGVRALLVAPRFDPRTLAAARALPVSLLALRWHGQPTAPELQLEPADAPLAPAPVLEPGPPSLESVFRTGLSEEEPRSY